MAQKVVKWSLWYEDGSRVDGASYEEWLAAPTSHVIYGMWFFEDGTAARLTGLDLYWVQDFGDGPVFAHDSDRDALLRRLPWVKHGVWTTFEKLSHAEQDAGKLADEWQSAGPARADQGCCS